MVSDELLWQIRQALGFEPTAGQHRAIVTFCRFVADHSDRVSMVMRGAAGTGKTSVAGAVVRALTAMQQKIVLLAPTGRAAKVFALNAGRHAFTIHRFIYRQKTFTGEMSGFTLNVNLRRDTLFIVDEASMIANQGVDGAAFGSGCLLDDLVSYVYSAEGCRLMLIGDGAQLPPVGEEQSPALSSTFMMGYGLTVYESDIDEVLRQAYGSGILTNATRVRAMLHDGMTLPRVCLDSFADIAVVAGADLVDHLAASYAHTGVDDTIVITRSNKRAMIYNGGIRSMVLDREDELTRGDMLMIVRNNYYWMQPPADEHEHDHGRGVEPEADRHRPAFLANGDRAVVRRVRHSRELYGLHFADVLLALPDYDGLELEATVVLDALRSEAPALTHEQQEQLFQGVLADYADLPRKADRMTAVRSDRHYNALQVKYAYAVTCHKAQGGQWSHVYVDQGYMTDDMLTPAYLHWLYTAFTRATQKLYLVNWPQTQIEPCRQASTS